MGMQVPVQNPLFESEPARSPMPAHYRVPGLIGDCGDEHEMAEEFVNSLTRAGDRLVGFVVGAGVLAAAWALWLLIYAIAAR